MMHWFYFEAFFKRKDTKWLDIIWNVQSLKGNTRDKSSSPALNKVDVLRSPVSKIPIFSGQCLMCKLHKKCSYCVFLFYTPTFSYFDVYLNTAYAAHYVYLPSFLFSPPAFNVSGYHHKVINIK